MGRRITPHAYAELIVQARKYIPGLAITTDIITGFPGETEAEFSESADFVAQMAFAGGHVFIYSPRPGTSAALLPDQVSQTIAKQRNAHIREIFERSRTAYLEQQVGHTLHVLWEKATPLTKEYWELSGLSDNYLRIIAQSPIPCRNQVMNVVIMGVTHQKLVGEIVQA
jgi:threonylcarbamoyladenosine tRNA methylthiotransferase MtaB